MSQGSHQKAYWYLPTPQETLTFIWTQEMKMCQPPLLYFHYGDSLQTGLGHNYNLNSLLCPFSCPLNWTCVFAKQGSDLITNHSVQNKQKKKNKQQLESDSNPDCGKMNYSSTGEASEDAFGWHPWQDEKYRCEKSSCGELASMSAALPEMHILINSIRSKRGNHHTRNTYSWNQKFTHIIKKRT